MGEAAPDDGVIVDRCLYIYIYIYTPIGKCVYMYIYIYIYIYMYSNTTDRCIYKQRSMVEIFAPDNDTMIRITVAILYNTYY